MLSEFALIKLCVENPVILDKSFKNLNLRFIRDPAAPEAEQETSTVASFETCSPEVTARKVSHLFYSVWSGVTKCLRNIVQGRQKAVEIPNFAIFGPVLDKFSRLKSPLDKGPLKEKLDFCTPVFVVINDDFLNSTDWKVAIDTTSAKAVGRFNKFERKEVDELFDNTSKPIGTTSIASSCHTDSQTVDLIIQELVAMIA